MATKPTTPNRNLNPNPYAAPGDTFDLYMAMSVNHKQMQATFRGWDWDGHPVKLLFSYAYEGFTKGVSGLTIEQFIELTECPIHKVQIMIDSGAFTAMTSGAKLTVDEYMQYLDKYMPRYRFAEVVSLDVIGNAEASYRNASIMREAGFDVLPVFHLGEDFKWLERYCDEWGKVGLGYNFGKPSKRMWYLAKCFSLCWPHRFHSFGWTAKNALSQYPFQSADSSSFLSKSVRFGQWEQFGKLAAKGEQAYPGTRGEVLAALKYQRYINTIWKKEVPKWTASKPKKATTPSRSRASRKPAPKAR